MSDITGQIWVSGSEVLGPNVSSKRGFVLKGHPSNASAIWFSHVSQTATTSGFPLAANADVTYTGLNLNYLKFSGSGSMCWLKLI
jgi:hypothetical protein